MAHSPCNLKDGTRVPSVTTILGVLAKPALVKWANGIGLRGIPIDKYVDEAARVGTLIHDLIECHLQKQEPDLTPYKSEQVSQAQKGLEKFKAWQTAVGFVPEAVEYKLISEKYRFGGTLDLLGRLADGRKVLVDIKTAKAVYDEHWTQVAGGYTLLLEENDEHYDAVLIVRIGRHDEEGLHAEVQTCPNVAAHQRRFLLCRELYDVNQEVKRGW